MKHNLRKKLIAALVMAATVMGGASVAQCGTLTIPNNTYAIEAIGPATVITIAPAAPAAGIIYTMGVARPANANFKVIYELPVGAQFTATPPVPVFSNPANVTLSTGGANTNSVEYFVDIPGGLLAGTTITLNAVTVRMSALPIAVGAKLSFTVKLSDAFYPFNLFDGTPVSSSVVTIQRASDFWNTTAGAAGVKSDTGTTVDANFSIPLAAFVVQNDDTALRAAATVQIRNTTPGVLNPVTGVDHVLLVNDIITVTITDVTGTKFAGLKTNGLWWDLNGNLTPDTNEVFTVKDNTATRTLSGNAFGFGIDRLLYYETDGTVEIDAPRVLSIAGSVAPGALPNGSGGTGHTFTGNDKWWSWDAPIGLTLQAPLFQLPPGWLCRFVLTNTSSKPAPYTTTFLNEAGVKVTAGTKATGTISAKSTLVLEGADVVSVTGTTTPRGTAIFKVDAPNSSIQGLYQLINAATGAVTNHVMVRPGTN